MDRNERLDVTRDAAGIGPHARPGVRLVSMKDLEYEVAEGDADVRGWEVRTVGGRELGKVADMLVDTSSNEVVMLDVDLEGTDRHTLAPVRAAQLDRSRRVVVLDSADLQEADAVPSLRRTGEVTDEEGRQFHERYQRAYGDRGWDRDRDWQVASGDQDLEFRRRPADVDRSAAAGLGAAAARAADAATPDVQQRDAALADATMRDAQRRERELRSAEEERLTRERFERERELHRQEEAERAEETRRAEEARRHAEEQRREVEQQRLAQHEDARLQDARMQQQLAQQGGATAAQPGTTSTSRQVRWAQSQPAEEIVVERRPVIEEVVIRRRIVDPDSPEARSLGNSTGEPRRLDDPRP